MSLPVLIAVFIYMLTSTVRRDNMVESIREIQLDRRDGAQFFEFAGDQIDQEDSVAEDSKEMAEEAPADQQVVQPTLAGDSDDIV